MKIVFSLKQVKDKTGVKIKRSEIKTFIKKLEQSDDEPISKDVLREYHRKISQLSEEELLTRFTI